jgi:hypothetical protein
VVVTELKLARGTFVGFKAEQTQNELNPAQDEKKMNSFLEYIFKLKINLEKSR